MARPRDELEMQQMGGSGHPEDPPTGLQAGENSATNQDGQNDRSKEDPPLAVYERDEDDSEENLDEQSSCKIWSSRVTKIILPLVLFLAITLGIFSTKLSLLVLVYPLRATANQATIGWPNQTAIGLNQTATCNLTRCSSDDTFCHMTENGTAVGPEDTDCVRIAAITTLSLTIMIPYAGVFLWSFWKGAFNSRAPWPTKYAAATGIAMSIFEVLGVCFFVLVILPSATSSQIANVLAMNAVHLLPLVVQFAQQIKLCRASKGEKFDQRPKAAFAAGVFVCTLGLIGYSLHSSVTFLVTLLPLTFAWIPAIKRFEMMTLRRSQIYRTQAGVDEVQPLEEGASDDDDHKTNARWKMGIITNLVKFLLTFPIINAIVYCDGTVEDTSILWQWAAQPLWRIDRNWNYFIAFLTNVCCATGVVVPVVVALKSKLQHAFALSIVISSLLFVLAVYVPSFCEFLSSTIPGLDLCETAGDAETWTWVAMIAMLLTELVMAVSVSLSPVEVMEPEAKLFWVPGCNAVFLNQHLLLNKKTEFNSPKEHQVKHQTVKNTHVYICTTMYRESKEEMTQLIKSIRDMATSPCKEDHRKYESHILFDDGCKQLEIQPSAIQLLSIIHEMTEVTNGADGSSQSLLDKCIKWQTPYWLQLQFDWRADGDSNRGMKFYIHLKDNLLVKNKKRWSQIMYMTYILDYMAYYKPLGMESGAIADDNIRDSSRSKCCEDNCLRLHAEQPWKGTTDAAQEIITIKLEEKFWVTGIILQAGAMGERVTKIKVGNQKETPVMWPTTVEASSGTPEAWSSPQQTGTRTSLAGSRTSRAGSSTSRAGSSTSRAGPSTSQAGSDASDTRPNTPHGNSTVTHLLEPKVLTDQLTIKLLDWTGKNDTPPQPPCLRMEIVGHADASNKPLGMKSGAIKDKRIKATPKCSNENSLRLEAQNPWNGTTAPEQKISIDLKEKLSVTGIILQAGEVGRRVTKIKVANKERDVQWPNEPLGDSKATLTLDPYIRTDRLTITLLDWEGKSNSPPTAPCLRMEILGQDDDLDRDTYILATDADVKFTPKSANKLLDLAQWNPNVGAVCGRTHCLGSGPMYWLQLFDYAVGHWFQKAANSTLGTVLCCPGCFSVYRCSAIRKCVSTYATKAEKAKEFLMKDMGEDRWLCTLMVERGCRLVYTSIAENSTFVPESFKEFFNQRRRWGPSTVANQLELLRKWGKVARNPSVSHLFLLYQALLFCSFVIGPATAILIAAGGLDFYVSGSFPLEATIAIMSIFTFMFGYVCLKYKQETQLKWAMVLGAAFGIVMIMTTVALVEKIVLTIRTFTAAGNTTVNSTVSSVLSALDTFYFLATIGMFLVTGLLHFREIKCLLHGILYFIALPTTFIFLNIYGVCNITDKSWGTREGKTSDGSKKKGIKGIFKNIVEDVRDIFRTDDPPQSTDATSSKEEEGKNNPGEKSGPPADNGKTGGSGPGNADAGNPRAGAKLTLMVDPGEEVQVWLNQVFKGRDLLVTRYQKIFMDNGYDDTSYIVEMTSEDLDEMKIKDDRDRDEILEHIKRLQPNTFRSRIPTDIEDWLTRIRLQGYLALFQKAGYEEQKHLAQLKSRNSEQLFKDIGINKRGHIKRLKDSIAYMREPTDEEKLREKVRKLMKEKTSQDMSNAGPRLKIQHRMWERLANGCLKTEQATDNFSSNNADTLKAELGQLRDSAIKVLSVVNVLWLVVIVAFTKSKVLHISGHNPLGILSLFVFGVIQVIQFLAMLYHRTMSFLHWVARADIKAENEETEPQCTC